MLSGSEVSQRLPNQSPMHSSSTRSIPPHAGECPLLIPPQQLVMAGPSFGLGETAASQKAGGHSLPVYLSITHKCLGDWQACYASIARLPQRSSGGSRTAPARRTEALRGRWAEGWAASRCFGWAGFQMLRFAQHDSSMSDFAGLRLGGILDASRWHDRLI